MLSGEIIDVKGSNLRVAYGESNQTGIPLYLMFNTHEIKIGTLLYSECTFFEYIQEKMKNDTEFAEKHMIVSGHIYSNNPDAMTFGAKHLTTPLNEFKSYDLITQEMILIDISK